MKRWKIGFLGLVLVLGAIACNTNELPAATSAGFVRPEASPTPSVIPPSPIPTIAPTEIRFPTETLPLPTEIPPLPTSTAILLATPLPCQETLGRVEERQLESDLLDGPLAYLVYLPPCYSEQPDRHYPVLYLFHGQTYSNRHWIDLGVTSIADRLISAGELAPFMMVFPYERDHYRPPTTNPFGQAVLFELIPAVDQEFRTIPERASRAIGGISRGGNWAAHLSLQNPELFSAVGLHSTPIFSTDTNREILEWLEAVPLEEFPRLFLDIGENDRWLKYTLVFEELLNDSSIPHEWHLYPGFHEDEYWESHLEQYIRWYTQDW